MPNAQHAVRQGTLLAGNIVATLRGRTPKKYVHHSLGTVATPVLGRGIFQWRGIVIKGLPAWLMHRGYHVLAGDGRMHREFGGELWFWRGDRVTVTLTVAIGS